MKRLLSFLLVLSVFVGPAIAMAAKTTYIYTDRRFQFVKRVELKKKELKQRKEGDHPRDFSGEQLRNMLEKVQVRREGGKKKAAQTKAIFDGASLNFLIPHLIKAFQGAKPNEEIVFSALVRKSTMGVQDNRLTIAHAWVRENFLHLRFNKLLAKINLTNYDKLGDVSKAMNKAEGSRMQLAVGAGQQFGDSMDEVLLSIPSQEVVELVERSEPVEAAAPGAASAPPEDISDVEMKLKKLKQLKKKGLITAEEYEQRRKEVLDQL